MKARGAWRARGIGWAAAGCLLGCGPLVPVEGSESASESEDGTTGSLPPGTTTVPPPPGTTTAPPPGTTTIPPPTDESTSGPAMTSNGFFDGFDASPGDECDFWAQDCPVGQKCMPWANDGGSSWNALRCSPIAEDPDAVGEPCTVEGSGVSGIDSCDAGAMCWDVDPETLAGHCVAFCTGDASNPTCPPDSMCAVSNDSVLALCFPNCHPLQPDTCASGEACYPLNDSFSCAPDASGDAGAPGDACEFINVCDPGSACVSSEYVPDCSGASGCCSAFCDIGVEPLCLPGQECLPWYEAGQAPPGYEDLGVCALPM